MVVRDLDPPFIIGIRKLSTVSQHSRGVPSGLPFRVGDIRHLGAGLIILSDAIENIKVVAGHDDLSL